MSDDVKHELFGGTDNAEAKGDDRSTGETESLAGQSNEDVGAETEAQKAERREKFLTEQTVSLAAKLAREGKSVDELPDAQKYLAPRIKAYWESLSAKQSAEKVEAKEVRSEVTVEEQVRYELLKEKLQSAGLPDKDKKKISALVSEFVASGKPIALALPKALSIMEINVENLQRAKSSAILSGSEPMPLEQKGDSMPSLSDINHKMTVSELMDFVAKNRK